MNAVERFAEGDLWGVLSDVYGSAMPEVFFTGAVATMILLVIYINSRSVVLTAITAMLSGGVIVEFLPPEVRNAGVLLIIAGVIAAGASMYTGRSRRVRTR